MGTRPAKGTVQKIPAGFDVLWVAAVITCNMEGRLSILRVRKKGAKNWRNKIHGKIAKEKSFTRGKKPKPQMRKSNKYTETHEKSSLNSREKTFVKIRPKQCETSVLIRRKIYISYHYKASSYNAVL